ncbi:amidase [Legionella erythra]|uniref:Amidase n=1 Tax=Legionella erythra TaxID=448 RepID=A0A0W0TWG2_LEGER|nr:amidase [Legionella erythra]KTC99840.1 amidase [Legionella erythra]
MDVKDYCRLDAHGLAAKIKASETTPNEAMDCALTRLKQVNPFLNAIVHDCSGWAFDRLKAMSGNEPFYGVPVVVKDLGFTLDGVPFTAGSRFFAGTVANANSDYINNLLSLGMLPFATTNTPELGLSFVTEAALHGPAKNPYDLSLTPGGSSGGSAAAVAAGIAPVATASDGGGSIRIPAACCGLFGFKPTQGLISLGPWVDESWSGLSGQHVITRTVRDSASVFAHQIQHQRPLTPVTPSRSKTVALVPKAFTPVAVDKPCLLAVDIMRQHLEALGYHVIEQDLSLDLELINHCARMLITANTAAVIESQQQVLGRKARKHELEPATWEFYREGKAMTASQLIRARTQLYRCLRPLHALLNDTAFLLTPALAQLPLKIGSLVFNHDLEAYLEEGRAFSPFTPLFNQANLPAMTMPVMQHGGLPVSVQIASGRWRDWSLLALAEQLEPTLPTFWPPLP